jgi:cation diffusion facilitator CzcD-associated flavoprotein CzcO
MPESKAKPEAISESASSFEAVVIGGGQAGLAMGYFLKRLGRNFVILEVADSIGSAWRTRWESLTLFTPRRYNSLPGLPFSWRSGGLSEPRRSDRVSRAVR